MTAVATPYLRNTSWGPVGYSVNVACIHILNVYVEINEENKMINKYWLLVYDIPLRQSSLRHTAHLADILSYSDDIAQLN